MIKAETVRTPIIEAVIGKDEFISFSTQNRIPNRENLNVICILDPDMPDHEPEVVKGFRNVIQSHFWDIERPVVDSKGIRNEIGTIYEPITDEQGYEIAKFILENRATGKFLIHCSAGISRSSGAAKAVECIHLFYDSKDMKYDYRTGHSSEIDKHWRYSPNNKVFDVIVDAAQRIQNESN